MLRYLIMLSLAPALSATALGDVITLQSGGEIRGTLEIGTGDADAAQGVTIESLSGVRITVPKPDVASVAHRPHIEEEYITRARAAENTVEAQWELAEWCRRSRLEEQQEKHLKAVIAIDSNHEAARQELDHVLRDGEWVPRAEIMRERGLVKHDRRWVTPQERDLIIKTAAQREQEEAWHAKIRLWHGWLQSGDATRYRNALDELRKLRDPTVIPAMAKYFSNDPNSPLRMLYIGVLKRIPGSAPVGPLVTQHLLDVDPTIRDAAFEVIATEHREESLPYLLEGLRNDNNKVVRRAGLALEQVGDERAVPDLIKALLTVHSRTIQVPEEVPSTTFSSNGVYGPAGIPLPPDVAIALRTGNLPYGVKINTPTPLIRMRPVTIRVNSENDEVLAALKKITGESFGFDERIWQQWWAGKKAGL